MKQIMLTEHQKRTLNNTEYLATSDKYNVIRTADVVDRFREHGFTIEDFKEAGFRKKEKENKVRHLVRMSIDSDVEIRRDIIIFNSYDSSTSLRLNFGLYRFYCENSIVIGDDLLPEVKIKHTRKNPFKYIDTFVDSVFEVLNKEKEVRKSMNRKTLTHIQQRYFLEKAASLRESNLSDILDIRELDIIQRKEDIGDSVWKMFNRIQENLLHGNYRKRGIIHDTDGNSEIIFRKAKEIKSPNENLKINKELYNIAMEFI